MPQSKMRRRHRPRRKLQRVPSSVVHQQKSHPETRTSLSIAALLTMPFAAVVLALSLLKSFEPARLEVARVFPFIQIAHETRALPLPFEGAAAVESPLLPLKSQALPAEAASSDAVAMAMPAKSALWLEAPTEMTPVSTPAAIEPVSRSQHYCSSEERDEGSGRSVLLDRELPFGERLAEAARAQTRDFIVYNDDYQTISYPMGDVSFLYGVCTDVIIRAYRALGIDLQKLVFESGLGERDRSIDHRRTTVLERFFEKYAETITPSLNPADYRPGDIVTYYRPNNRGVRTHIAIVSREIGPSGAPMIIHNRGNGPQVEDALFADPITGHFRFEAEGRTIAENPIVRGANKIAR